ncbi:MAG: MCE family protein [Rhizobiales bacterium]|nr:MCE family protein [Hyphomicrobiales bacterium]
METRARYALIGLFTLVVIVAGFVFVYWIKRLDETGIRAPVYFEFSGSVGGLAPGGAVYFAGIKVGTVTALAFDAENPDKVRVTAEVRQDVPVKTDTRAVVGSNLLTGVAYIDMTGGTGSAPSIFAQDPPLIVGAQSAFSDVLAAASSAVSKLESIASRLDSFVADNQVSITNTTRNVEAFTGALAENAEGIKSFLASVAELSDTASRLSSRLDGIIAKADEIVTAVDPEKVDGILTSTNAFMQRAAEASDNIQSVIAQADTIAAELTQFSTGLNETLGNVKQVVAGVDPSKVQAAVDSVSGFADKLRDATPDVDGIVADVKSTVADVKSTVADVKGTVTAQKDNVDAIITNAKELAAKLNAASDRIDNVLGAAENVLKDEEGVGKNFFQEATAAAKALRQTAETINARAGDITNGLAAFSTRGLADVASLINELRASVARMDRAIVDLARDPGGAIFGGNSGVREYNRK